MKIFATFATAAVLSAAFVLPAGAQNQTPPPPFCENNPGFDDFNFWVGEWNVYSNDEDRTFQGTNSVTKHYNNCLIIEDWHGAQGGDGMSINYYNPVTGEWRQVWVANGYSVDYTGGLNDDGAMVLEGTIYGYRPNKGTPFRGIWTAQDDGSVVQHFDIMGQDGNWTVWFEGLYVKKENDETMDH